MSEGITTRQEGLFAGSQLDTLAAAAHELKTPLTVISHIAATAEQELASMSLADGQQALQRIRLSADRTLQLVQSLTIARRLGESGQLPLGFALEPLNVGQLCEEAVDELLPFAKAQQVGLRAFAPRPLLVVGNRVLLRSVFCNLLDNAVKHSGNDAAVEVRLSRHRGMVRVSVQDSGPRLKRRDLTRLSRTIGKELQPLHGRAASSGLGLYVAAQMVEAMGGRLSVGLRCSQTNFWVDLVSSRQLSLW